MALRCLSAMVLVAIVAAIDVRAHHSLTARYDPSKPITLTGTVTKIEWLNPHVRFYADVKDQDGKIVNWEFELGAGTANLVRRGWTRTSLKAGDVITVEGSPARDGSALVNASSVSLADGRRIFAGSPADGPPR